MNKTLDKCLKCSKACKLESETKAQLLSCREYLSKRSISLLNPEGKGNVSPAKDRGL